MNFRTKLERRKGQRDSAIASVQETRTKLTKAKRRQERLHEAQQIIQTVAQATQADLEYRVSELVSLALSATFEETYNLHLDFVSRRGGTEADISISRGNHEECKIHPLRSGGGGICDITSLALRLSVCSLRRPALSGVYILDEPFKNISDPSRKLHEKVAKMLRQVVDQLGVQIIMITLNPEMIDIADKTFRVTRKNRVSKVKEV